MPASRPATPPVTRTRVALAILGISTFVALTMIAMPGHILLAWSAEAGADLRPALRADGDPLLLISALWFALAMPVSAATAAMALRAWRDPHRWARILGIGLGIWVALTCIATLGILAMY